jgi:RNA polymerase sigma-70 factor (ECF subfamily)
MEVFEHGADRVELFERERPRLFGIAYRMLGSVHDAEDVLHSAYLRWHEVDAAGVRNPEAWLATVVSRLAIDRLRSATGERERYAGDWLPEPISTSAPPADARAELASDISMAFLALLERLSPDERAAFLLHEVFGADYREVASVLGKGEAACRQIVHRARERVRAERTRFPVAPEVKQRLVGRLLAGLEARDEAGLLALVAEDASWTSDGGGKVPAARKLRGAYRIVRFLLAVTRKAGDRGRRELVWINGEPAIATHLDGRLHSVVSIESDGEHLRAFYSVLNPEKLRHVVAPASSGGGHHAEGDRVGG